MPTRAARHELSSGSSVERGDILLLLDYQAGHEWAISYVEFPHGEDVQAGGAQPVIETPFPED